MTSKQLPTNLALLDLSPIGFRKVPAAKFRTVTGKVLDSDIQSSTSVNVSGGGASRGRIDPINVHSDTIHTSTIWIEDADGKEKRIALHDSSVSVRAGQMISAIVLETPETEKFAWITNHSDGTYYQLYSAFPYPTAIQIPFLLGVCLIAFTILGGLLIIGAELFTNDGLFPSLDSVAQTKLFFGSVTITAIGITYKEMKSQLKRAKVDAAISNRLREIEKYLDSLHS